MTTFGLQIPGLPPRGRARRDDVRRHVSRTRVAAEASGFDSVWVMDHFWQLPALGGPDEPILEAYTLLGALAARTERVQLGTLVTGVTYRNPRCSPRWSRRSTSSRRAAPILGIGAAWYEPEHDGFGFDFPRRGRAPRPARGGGADLPRAVPRRAPDVRRAATTRSTDARNVPRPIQPGGPPIMIGGSGERRTLRLVAQYADMCNVIRRPAPRSRTSSTCCAATATTSAATRRRSRRPGSARSCSPPTPTRPAHVRELPVGTGRATSSTSSSPSARPTRSCDQVGALVDAGPRLPDLQHAALRPRHGRRAPASCSPRTSRSLGPVTAASPSDSATRPTRSC